MKPDRGTVFWVCVYVLIVYAVLYRSSPVLAMRWWRWVTGVCHSVAFTVGVLGIEAEKAYWLAVERARA